MSDLLRRLMQQQEQFFASVQGTQVAQKDLLSEINQMRGPIMDEAQRKAALEQAGVAIAGAGELQTAKENRAAASAFGVNMADPTSLVVETATQAREAVARANREAAVAKSKSQISLAEDPLGAIAALFTVPFHTAQAGREAQMAADAATRLTLLNQAAQTQFRTNENLKRGVTEETIANKLETGVAAANLALMQLREQQMRSNIKDVTDVLALDKTKLDILFQSYQIGNEQERLQLAREGFALQRQKYEADLAKDQLEEDLFTDYLSNVNIGRAIYGLKPMTTNEFKVAVKNPRSKAMIDQWYDSGSVKASTGVSNIATDPASSLVLLTQAGVRFNEGDPRKPVQDLLTRSTAEFRQSVAGQTATKGEEILNGTNTVVAQRTTEQQRLIKPDDLTNIYSALPFASIVKNKAVQATSLYSTLLSPQEEAGVVDIPPHQIFSQTAQAVAAGTLKLEEAADGIVTYAKAAVSLNNEGRQYAAFGLPNQRAYPTSVAISAAGQTATVDLTDSTQVTAALLRFRTNKQARDVSEQNPLFWIGR